LLQAKIHHYFLAGAAFAVAVHETSPVGETERACSFHFSSRESAAETATVLFVFRDMPDTRPNEVTALLQAAQKGDPDWAARLLPLVYAELRQLAQARMARLRPGQTLQPTALVHEAYLRLLGKSSVQPKSRRHFFFLAARAMRDILVEQARSKSGPRRGGGRR